MTTAFPYVPQSGDVRYTIPGDGAWGIVFSRGADPAGARIPTACVMRDGRVFLLYDAAVYGIASHTYVTEERMVARGGMGERSFCVFVGSAFREWAASFGNTAFAVGSPPATLVAGAEAWGWPLA